MAENKRNNQETSNYTYELIFQGWEKAVTKYRLPGTLKSPKECGQKEQQKLFLPFCASK